MAADISTLTIEVDSRGVTRARDELGRFAAAGEKSASVATKATSAWKTFSGVMAALGVGLAIRELVQVADTMSLLDARLKLATKSSLEFMQAQADIYRIAQQNNVGIEETTQLYVKLSKPIRDLGGSTKEVAGITDAFAKSLRVGGASAQEASAATLQFAQAMASGKLSGDEFRSLAEASPRFMQALADGMGVSTGALKEMSTEGRLTADVVGNALLKSLTALSQEAAAMPDTVGGAFTRLANDAKVAINELNKSSGLTLGIAEGIEAVRSLIPTIKTEIQGVVSTVGDFLERNKVQIGEAWEATLGLASSLWEAAKAAGTIVGFVAEWALQNDVIKTGIEAIRIIVAGVVDGVTILGASFATVGSQIMQWVTEPLRNILSISAKIAGVFDQELAAKIAAINSSMTDFVTAGEQYGNQVTESFQAGESALGRLNKELEDSKRIKDILKETALSTAEVSNEMARLTMRTKDASSEFATLSGVAGKDKGADKALKEYEKLIASIKEKIALEEAELTKGRELTKAEQLQVQVIADLTAGRIKLSDAQRGNVNTLLDAYKAAENEVSARKAAAKLHEQTVANLDKETATYNRQIELLKEQEEQYGNTAVEIAFMQATKINAMAADKEAQAVVEKDIALQEEYREQAKKLREIASRGINVAAMKQTGDALKDQINEATKGLESFYNYMEQLDLSKFDNLFGGSLKNVDKMLASVKLLGSVQDRSEKAREDAAAKYGKGSVEYQKEIQKINSESTVQTLQGYGQVIGAAKGFFDEQSRGYKMLEVAQAALGVATAAAAIANQGLGDPYTAIPRIIAMAATMAQLGFAIGGLSGGGGAAPTNQGTGTVFGDVDAKSASIENSIDLLADSAVMGLRYSAQMAASLKNIEAAMVGVTSLLLRGGGVGDLAASIPTGYMGTGTLGAVESVNKLSSMATFGPLLGKFTNDLLGGLLGGLQQKIFGKKVSVQGGGIFGGPQSLGDIEELGFEGSFYADIQEKRFLGRTKNRTEFSELDSDISRQFTLIFGGIGDTVKAAAGSLGLDMGEITNRLNAFVVDIGRIDLKDLSGEEIQEKLSSVFGAAADKIAEAVVPGFEELVKVGEGPFETLVRVAHQLEVVDTALNAMSKTLGGGLLSGIDRAINADKLVQEFGGLDEFQTATDDFYRAFWSQADQTRNTLDLFKQSLAGLGMELPASSQGFRDLVTGLDLTTEEGRQAFAVLTQIGPAFADMQEQMLSAAGIGADEIAGVIRDGMLGRMSQEDVGSKLTSIVVDGIYGSLAMGYAQQITDAFSTQILQPIVQSVATGAAISASVSQASIDSVVATATSAMAALGSVLSDPGFQAAMQGVTGAISGMAGVVAKAAPPIVQTYVPAVQSFTNAVSESANVASEAAKAWSKASEDIQKEIDRLRGGGVMGEDQAGLHAQFAIANAQARAGDLKAFESLPELSRALDEATKNSATSLIDYRRQQGDQALSLEGTLFGTARATTTGNLYGTPTGYSGGTAATGGDLQNLMLELKAAMQALAVMQSKTVRLLERWDATGMPVVNQAGETLDVSTPTGEPLEVTP